MRGLNSTTNSTNTTSITKKFMKELKKLKLNSIHKILFSFSIKLNSLPLKIRPAFIILTTITLLILSALGFHPTLATHIAPTSIPFSDKLLHFICFFLASLQFYFIWNVIDDEGKWWWIWWNEGISIFVCGFVGSIGSEFVQSLLPYKTFQLGDIIANILGTTLGILTARSISKSQKRQLELNRLYRPVDLSSYGDEEDEEEEVVQEEREREEELLVGGGGRAERGLVGNGKNGTSGKKINDNPWDDNEEEIFGIGDDD